MIMSQNTKKMPFAISIPLIAFVALMALPGVHYAGSPQTPTKQNDLRTISITKIPNGVVAVITSDDLEVVKRIQSEWKSRNQKETRDRPSGFVMPYDATV